jgi:hypothetical protein
LRVRALPVRALSLYASPGSPAEVDQERSADSVDAVARWREHGARDPCAREGAQTPSA